MMGHVRAAGIREWQDGRTTTNRRSRASAEWVEFQMNSTPGVAFRSLPVPFEVGRRNLGRSSGPSLPSAGKMLPRLRRACTASGRPTTAIACYKKPSELTDASICLATVLRDFTPTHSHGLRGHSQANNLPALDGRQRRLALRSNLLGRQQSTSFERGMASSSAGEASRHPHAFLGPALQTIGPAPGRFCRLRGATPSQLIANAR